MSQKKKKLSRLEKLMTETNHRTSGKEEYMTTLQDTKKWIRILNKEIFDGSLSKLDEIDIRRRRMCYAYYLYYPITKDDEFRYSKLCMANKYVSEKFFVEILAHELIHHYQYINEQPMGHGPSFMKWKEIFNKKGLNLVKMYYQKPKKSKRGRKK